MKKLKEDLEKENKRWSIAVSELEEGDIHLRKEFTALIGSQIPNIFGGYQNKNNIMSWEEVFFRVGELKADADYTCLLEQNNIMRRELENFKNPTRKEEYETKPPCA